MKWRVPCTRRMRRSSAASTSSAESKRYEALLRERCGVIDVPGFEDMAARMQRLHDFAMTDET